MIGIIIAIVVVLFVLVVAIKSFMVVPQAQAAVIERLGRYRTTAGPGMNFLAPFFDRVRARIDKDAGHVELSGRIAGIEHQALQQCWMTNRRARRRERRIGADEGTKPLDITRLDRFHRRLKFRVHATHSS